MLDGSLCGICVAKVVYVLPKCGICGIYVAKVLKLHGFSRYVVYVLPKCCRNVDLLPFWQLSGTPHDFFSKGHAKFFR